MLTHCLPMPGILAIIQVVYRSQLKCIYLKNQKIFVDSFNAFLESTSISKHFEEETEPYCLNISEVIHYEKR